MSVYSTQLFKGLVGAGLTIVYTAPAGSTVVIRDLEVCNTSGGVAAYSVSIEVAGSTKAYIKANPSLANNATDQWVGRAVLIPADELTISCGAANFFLLASGYLLS